jgi:hypothetical protein
LPVRPRQARLGRIDFFLVEREKLILCQGTDPKGFGFLSQMNGIACQLTKELISIHGETFRGSCRS